MVIICSIKMYLVGFVIFFYGDWLKGYIILIFY